MMLKKLLPVLLLVIGSGVGVGAGMFLRPAPEPPTEEELALAQEEAEAEAAKEKADDTGEPTLDESKSYVKMANQFVIPIVEDDAVSALVVMSLSLEVQADQQEAIYSREPKLRDAFLQVLFDHANVGGFDGAFTNANNMDVLRVALREIAQKTVGDAVHDVLIQEIARQDY